MVQFSVYQNTNPSSKKAFPFLVDIQSNLLDDLRTTVVIPLAPLSTVDKPISRLCPILEIDTKKYVAVTQQLAGIDRKLLGKRVADLSEYRSDFIAALDFVISGI
ncbi:CcdB-like toxin protein [gamma proteobacterium HdN1]|nr:CcdB-like toxin protein [gamma proteobacterium HdN1]